MTQTAKNLPATQETWVQSLGWEDPLERKWQPTPAFLSGEFHGQRSLTGFSPLGHKKSKTTEGITFSDKKNVYQIKQQNVNLVQVKK